MNDEHDDEISLWPDYLIIAAAWVVYPFFWLSRKANEHLPYTLIVLALVLAALIGFRVYEGASL